MNIGTGIVLVLIGLYSVYRIITGKEKQGNRLIFKHQIFYFEVLFGKEKAYKALVIFTSIIEISFGLAFITGELTW